MKGKKILKEAIILLISTIIISPTIIAIAETNEEKIMPIIRKTTINTVENPTQTSQILQGPVMFSQEPYTPNENHIFYLSDIRLGYRCIDDYWGLTDSPCNLHWWGTCEDGHGGQCYPIDMSFEIIFYDDNAGQPGSPVCVYQFTPMVYEIGKFYDDITIYYWEVDLNPCCPLTNGWISIQSISSNGNCYFYWAGSPDGNWNAMQNQNAINDNLAFQITKEGQCNPSIDVEKYVWDGVNAKWVDADTESTAHRMPIGGGAFFNVVITNNGNVDLYNIVIIDDMLDNIAFISSSPEPGIYEYSYPFYYMQWYYPGPLTPGSSIEIHIEASIEGPDGVNTFNSAFADATSCGYRIDDSDMSWIHAYERSRVIKSPFLEFLKNHPHLFPIIRQILNL